MGIQAPSVVFGQIQLFVGYWTESLSSPLAVDQSLPTVLTMWPFQHGSLPHQNVRVSDFLGPVVMSPPASSAATASIPGLGRPHVPQSTETHMPQLLTPSSRACKPQRRSPRVLETMLCHKRKHRNERPKHQN